MALLINKKLNNVFIQILRKKYKLVREYEFKAGEME